MLSNRQLSELRSAAASPNRLREAMRLAKLTQAGLAEAVGFTQSYISEIASGNYASLPLETAQRLADHFGCSTDELFPLRAA